MATTVSFKRPNGQTIHGYLAEPEHAAGAAAVVVIQEWWGVNQQIRGVADRLVATSVGSHLQLLRPVASGSIGLPA